jgi:hypothetical protein
MRDMAESTQELLPRAFCWTRMGTEAGETLESILSRKELERQATGGLFLWGIGNSIGEAVDALARRVREPEVLFSCTKTHARPIDVTPDRRVVWTGAVTTLGQRYHLPRGTRVMGGVVNGRRLPPRYALVCASERPLDVADHGSLRFSGLRNLVSGRPVGASQVTAVVERSDEASVASGTTYLVRLRARLVSPYFVRLTDPVLVSDMSSPVEVADSIVA